MKNLNNDWLATSKKKLVLKKKKERNKRITLVWGVIKGLVRTGYYVCRIIEFVENFFKQD